MAIIVTLKDINNDSKNSYKFAVLVIFFLFLTLGVGYYSGNMGLSFLYAVYFSILTMLTVG